MAETRHTGAGYYVAATVLIVLLLAAIGFIVGMVLRPSVAPPEALVVTDRASVACPIDHKNTTCYDTQITNSGGSEGTFTCRLDAAGDTEATFADGLLIKQVIVGPSQSVHLVAAVTAPGVSPASAPRVLCTDLRA
jgi:hypothetical protein